MGHDPLCAEWYIPANTMPFCSECGGALQTDPRCAKCRAKRLAHHKFCPMCGNKHDG